MINTIVENILKRGCELIWLRVPKGKDVNLFSITYNAPDVVETQIKNIKKYMTDEYSYCVVDNSSIRSSSNKIKQICKREGVQYVKVLYNPYNGKDPSRSHAWAISLLNSRVGKISHKAEMVGYLDHDIFPIEKTSLKNKLSGDKNFYGLKQKRGERWYIWPGFFIFKSKFSNKLDFSIVSGLDTGGANYKYLMPRRSRVNFASVKVVNILHGNGNRQNGEVEIIDGWFHIINASLWGGKISKAKFDFIKKYANK